MPFIVLEGLDGAGKSTQINKLAALLTQKGVQYRYLHFPRFDAPVYGELIARFLRGEMGALDQVDPYLVALIYAGDRADAAPLMRQWLDSGIYIITDRFVYSNIAYQCAKIADPQLRNSLREWILSLEYGYNKIPRPDLSLFLDVPFEFTRDRLAENREGDDRDYLNGGRDIHEESLELQSRVREVYLSCAADYNDMQVVDCSDGNGKMDTPDGNFDKIIKLLNPLL